MLDLYPEQQNRALEAAFGRVQPEIEPALMETFRAARVEHERLRQAFSRARNRFDVVQAELDRVFEATGERMMNPFSAPQQDGRIPEYTIQQFNQRFERLNREHPGLDARFPSNDEIAAKALALAREAAEEYAAIDARFDFWSWNTLAAFGGGMVGALEDPVNLVSMFIGPTAGASILGAGAISGGVAGVTEAGIQAVNFGFRQEVDPEFGLLDSAGEVGFTAAGGFIFGSGVQAAGKGLAKLFGLSGERARDGMSRAERDAANVTARSAANGVGAPRPPSPRSDAAHVTVLNGAADDLERGRPVEIPEDAFLQQDARPGRIYDADGRNVAVNYEVVEASDLVTSHNRELTVNPDYPQELQARNRDSAISQAQINGIAANLQPERLGVSAQADSGAPVIGPDGIVESGNGRVLAIREAYRKGTVAADNYRAFLRAQGFDIDDMAQPVMVARRLTDLTAEERVRFAGAANRSTAMRLSTVEQAGADARLITDEMIALLQDADVKAMRNRDFVKAFNRELSRSEQGATVSVRGALSQEGERRLVAALLARAYGDVGILTRTLEDTSSNIKAIGNALADAAPAWARLRAAASRGDIPARMDITEDLLGAVHAVMAARDAGRPLREFLDQAEMFGGPSEIAKALGRAMFRDGDLTRPASRKAVAELLRDYVEGAEKNLAGPRLIGDPFEANQILESTLRRIFPDADEFVPETGARFGSDNKLAPPERVYHGTAGDIKRFRVSSGEDQLYGPGVYFTEDPTIASNYARNASGKGLGPVDDIPSLREFFKIGRVLPNGDEVLEFRIRKSGAWEVVVQGPDDLRPRTHSTAPTRMTFNSVVGGSAGPNVVIASLEVRNALRMDAPVPRGDLEAIAEAMRTDSKLGFSEGEATHFQNVKGERSGDDVYQALLATIGSKTEVNEFLESAGFDGITHIGGQVTGGKPHRVWIAFDPKDAVPGIRPPKESPVISQAVEPEHAAEVAGSTDAEDVVLRELDAMRAEEDLTIAVSREGDDGERIVERRSVDELFDELDEEIAAGERIEVCITGKETGE